MLLEHHGSIMNHGDSRLGGLIHVREKEIVRIYGRNYSRLFYLRVSDLMIVHLEAGCLLLPPGFLLQDDFKSVFDH